MRIIRVFPRRTSATPDDELVRIGTGPDMLDEADEVHISVAFTWDLPMAEQLQKQWACVASTKIGGPATGERGGDFVPGMYVKQGYVITSRGCPNKCWFCSVWRREGNEIRELPITSGNNVLDDNLLACTQKHQESVFAMLKTQRGPIQFTGGLEAKRLTECHAKKLRELKPKQVFFAYDTPDDLDPLQQAGKLMIQAGFTTRSHVLRAYVLCGFPGDTIARAEKRMKQTVAAGFMPMAMLYRDKSGCCTQEWKRWSRLWARPAIISTIAA